MHGNLNDDVTNYHFSWHNGICAMQQYPVAEKGKGYTVLGHSRQFLM